MSPILFLFYISPLLEKPSQEEDISVVGLVDDVAILVEGNTSEENCNRLLCVHKNICKPWAHHHGSKFAPNKYQLSHLTRKRTANLDHPLSLHQRTIFPKRTITYHGAVLITKILWHEQVLANETKALKSIGGIAGLAGSRGRALYKLEPSTRRGIVKLHLGLTKELSALVVQMRTEKNRTLGILIP